MADESATTTQSAPIPPVGESVVSKYYKNHHHHQQQQQRLPKYSDDDEPSLNHPSSADSQHINASEGRTLHVKSSETDEIISTVVVSDKDSSSSSSSMHAKELSARTTSSASTLVFDGTFKNGTDAATIIEENGLGDNCHLSSITRKKYDFGETEQTVAQSELNEKRPAKREKLVDCTNLDDVAKKLSSVNLSEDGVAESLCHLDDLTTDVPNHIIEDEFGIQYVNYQSEHQMPDIMRLISKDLSEPYSIYTYRYFIHNWPQLCYLAKDGEKYVGAVVCKLDIHKRTMSSRGYIAMLAVDETYRRKKIASRLVSIAIEEMVRERCDEVVLETECTNVAALRLYEQLGFVRDKRLFKYYLNGVDAFRLKLWIT